MPWPPSDHGQVEDAVTSLRGMAQFPTGVYVTAPGNTIGVTAGTVGRANAMPLFLPTGTVSELTVRVTIASTGGGTVQLGIFDSDPTPDASNGRIPGTLLASAAAVSTDTTGIKSVTISQAITGGLYWLGAVNLVASATFASVSTDSPTGRVGAGVDALSNALVVHSRSGQTSISVTTWSLGTPLAAGIRVWCVMSAIG